MKKTDWIYKVTDNSTGEVLGVGTAEELVDQGLYGDAQSVASAYRRCKKKTDARRLVERLAAVNPEPKHPCHKKPPAPQPLDEDAHQLMLLNDERRRQGKPALTYGRWKAGLR